MLQVAENAFAAAHPPSPWSLAALIGHELAARQRKLPMTQGPCGCLASSSPCGLVEPSSHTLLAVAFEAQQKQRWPDGVRFVIRHSPWDIAEVFELITNTIRPPTRNGPRKLP